MAEATPAWRLLGVALALSLTLGAAAGAIAGRHDGDGTVVTASTLGRAPSTTLLGRQPSVPDIVAATRPSIVLIRATVESDDPAAGALLVDATGTGFVIRSDGMIATAAHVVAGAWSVSVSLADGDTRPATIRGVDEATDLAVLSIDRDDLVPLDFGQTSAVRVGETVIALGHALDLGVEPTVSVGVLSAVERTITGSDGRTYDHLLQTDAAINIGDSGGPLVNGSGQVIGINTSRISSNDAEGVGFAICTDHALPMLVRLEGS